MIFPWYSARIPACVRLLHAACGCICRVSYGIFIKSTSMSSSPLWSLLSQRLAHLVTILHCLLQEQRPRQTEFTVRTLKSLTCTCIKPEGLRLLLSPSIPPFFLEVGCIWNWSHKGVSGKDRLVHWCHWSGTTKTKNIRPFVHIDPFLTWHITQSKDMVSICQLNFING